MASKQDEEELKPETSEEETEEAELLEEGAKKREDTAGVRVALNRPVSLSQVQKKAEEQKRKIAAETTHVGPPTPTSSSD